MPEKFVPRHSIENEIRKKSDKSKFVGVFLSTEQENDASAVEYRQVPVDEIVPRFVNKYRQSRIEQLADSIHNTNDRMIHPIVLVRAADLPEHSEVVKAIEQQGKKPSDYNYIIVSGERRFRAWLLLREREAQRIAGRLGEVNRFDTVTANILTRTEALNEASFYSDANNQARHITAAECVWFIKDALRELTSDELKREAMIRINGGSEQGIDPDPVKASKRFRADSYCRFLLDSEMGVTDWSDATLRNMATVATNCDDFVADALLAGSFPLREARAIATLDGSEQRRLVELFVADRAAYDAEMSALKSGTDRKPQKITHGDTRRQLKATLKRIRLECKELSKYADGLGSKNNRNELDAVKKYESFIEELTQLIENTK